MGGGVQSRCGVAIWGSLDHYWCYGQSHPPTLSCGNLSQGAGLPWARSATVNQGLPTPGAGRPWKRTSVYYKTVLYLESSTPPETRHLLLIGPKLQREVKLNRTFSAGAGRLTVPPSAALFQRFQRFQNLWTGAGAGGSLDAFQQCWPHCVLEPRVTQDDCAGVPNARGRERCTLSHMQHVHTQHVLIHSLTDALTQCALYSHMQCMLTHVLTRDTHEPMTHSPVCAHVLQCTCLHTHRYTLSHTHTHRYTDPQSGTHVPPQEAHIHPCRRKKAPEKHTRSTQLATPITTSQRPARTDPENTHFTQEHIHTKIHAQSPAWTATKATMHTKTHRKPHTGPDAHTHKVTTSCFHTPKSSQRTVGPGTHPGQDCPDTGHTVLPALAQQPEPTLRAYQQHHQQIKSECAKIKPKGCDKAVPFPQDSALTQVLLSAINISF